MPTKKTSKKKSIKKAAATVAVNVTGFRLADEIVVPRVTGIYAVPYYTRDGDDTEYLISNPNTTAVKVLVAVFGKECKVIKRIEFDLKPNCTRSITLRAIQPELASFSLILVEGGELVVHLLYSRPDDLAIVGGELAGLDNLFNPRNEGARTYAFGYRTQPYRGDKTRGSVFISNPNNTVISGQVTFFGQKCSVVDRKRFQIKPGCTQEFPFPKDDFGYGVVDVSRQPVINVLHFADSAKGLTAAELVGEGNRVTRPSDPPKPRSRILFDDTHGCRTGVTGDWTQYEAALVAAGYTTTHYTAASVTLAALQQHDVFVVSIPRSNYTAAEKKVIVDYVNGGGGLLVVQDFGNAPWSVPTREVLNLFGAMDDNNFMEDPTHCFTPGQFDDVVFDYQRNFLPHPITAGWKSFHVDAASSLSGGAGWNTVVETDDDSTPPNRPAVLARAFGAGRVVAFGDSNTWANHLIANLENKTFGVRCMQWLLFVI
jgi:hypothetical protein